MNTNTENPSNQSTNEQTTQNPRLQPMQEDEFMVMTDRQAEDHAQKVRGEQPPTEARETKNRE